MLQEEAGIVEGGLKEVDGGLQEERRKSRVTTKQLLDNAKRVMMEAEVIKQADSETVHLERQHAASVDAVVSDLIDAERQRATDLLHEEQQYNACQITGCKSYIQQDVFDCSNSPLFCLFVPFFSEK